MSTYSLVHSVAEISYTDIYMNSYRKDRNSFQQNNLLLEVHRRQSNDTYEVLSIMLGQTFIGRLSKTSRKRGRIQKYKQFVL